MDSKISYSVVIRTLGNAGKAYVKLLNSIYSQTIQPEEVIVVIPKGYSLDYKTGKEKIIFSNKGMCTQRVVGISAVTSEYMLVVDDDVCFAPTMIQELYDYLIRYNLDADLPMEGLGDDKLTIDLRKKRFTRLRGSFTGQYFESKNASKYLDKLTVTAGHKVFINNNKKDTMYLCETACFQCFFIKTSVAKLAHFEEELWLEQGSINHYSAYDEPVFFYKLKTLLDFRMSYNLNVYYQHLDARCAHETTKRGILLSERYNRLYSFARNRTIYWYKFIWLHRKDFVTLCGGLYMFINYTLYNILINLNPKYWKVIKSMFIGYKDAFVFIKQM